MPTYYFYGEDTYRARQAIRELSTELGAKTRILDRSDFEQRSVSEWFSQGSSGLFGQEMLVIRDAQEFPQGLQEEIIEALRKSENTLCLVWERGRGGKSRLYKALGKRGKEFGSLGKQEILRWVKEEATKGGFNLDEGVAEGLVDRVGDDSWRLMSELARLAAKEGRVSLREVEKSVAGKESAEIFSTLRALIEKDKLRAIRGIEVLLEEGNSEFYILSMLAYQFRTLLLVKRGIDQGKSQSEIAKENNLSPYAVQKSYQPAKFFTVGYLREALIKILATDFSIKQGKVDARTGLMMLVVGLAK